MPVGELLARTSSHELTEWMAYEQEYGPLGPERGDWQAANVAYTVAVMLAGKKGRKLKMNNFLLKWTGARRRQSPEDMLSVFRAVQAKQAEVAAKRKK